MTAPTTSIAGLTADAGIATVAWLNAFLATSQDDSRPVLYRTLSVEFYPTGAQFIATDGTVMFRAWAPAANAIVQDWPGDDVQPDVSDGKNRSVYEKALAQCGVRTNR
jgi:hypothetical protein